MAKIRGTNASETLNSGSGSDYLLGLGGNDTLNGGGGNDRLEGGAGTDRLVGGAGNDFYRFTAAPGKDTIVEAAKGGGTDTVLSTVTFSLAKYANVENLTLQGTAAIKGTGNSLKNGITGNSGSNRLAGEGGNDTLIGGLGHDSLNGGAGADSLSGGSGDDTLVGGTGTDKLLGDSGDDVLVWDNADASVDGGSELTGDILLVTGNLDLTAVADDKIVDIEAVNLAGAAGTLILDAAGKPTRATPRVPQRSRWTPASTAPASA